MQECHTCGKKTKEKTQQHSKVQGQTEGNTSLLTHRDSFVDETVEEFIRVSHDLDVSRIYFKFVQNSAAQNVKNVM